MIEPHDFLKFADTRYKKFLKCWKTIWKRCSPESFEDLLLTFEKSLDIIKSNQNIYSQLNLLFDDYQKRWNDTEIAIYRKRKAKKLKLYAYFHDTIHLFLNIMSLAKWYEKYGILFQYQDLDYDDGRIICAVCSMNRFKKTACIEYDYYDKPRKDTWCWREHNLIGKKAWKNIPEKNFRFNPRSKKPFSKENLDEKFAVDTLNFQRKNLEQQITYE
jgi:hypothetical protein